MTGTIRQFNLKKGFGFVQTKTHDYFFHVSNFTRTGVTGEKPCVGEQVSFEVGPASMQGKQIEAFKLRPVASAGLTALAKGLGGVQ